MDDLAIRELLALLTHQLKAHVQYMQRLHRSYVALYDAQKAADPEFESRYYRAAGQSQAWRELEGWLRRAEISLRFASGTLLVGDAGEVAGA